LKISGCAPGCNGTNLFLSFFFFQKTIEPFLREVFMLVVRAIFDVLSRQTANDVSVDDVKTIRRTYFQFLHALVTNNVAQVVLCQGMNK